MKGEYVFPAGLCLPRKETAFNVMYRAHRRALLSTDEEVCNKAWEIEQDIIAKRTTLDEHYPLDAETLDKLANQPDPADMVKDIEIKSVSLKGGKPSESLEYKVKITSSSNIFSGSVKFEIVHVDSEEVIDTPLYKELNKALVVQVLEVLKAREGVNIRDSERLHIDTINDLASGDPRYKGCIYVQQKVEKSNGLE